MMTPRHPMRSEQEHEERIRCIRTLLATPLVTAADDHGEFRKIRRHAPWLRKWFAEQFAWGLVVESEYVRLAKYPARLLDGSRPAYDVKKHTPFTRRRYVMLCLALAVLERSERQTVLGKLALEMTRLAQGDPVLEQAGMGFDLERRDQRVDLVAAIRLLIDWGVLVRIHGNEEAYVQSSEDVLYTIHRPVLGHVLSVQRGPSTIETSAFKDRLHGIQAESAPESDEGRRRRLRVTLMRMLVDNPIVYYGDLREDELAYLNSQRSRLVGELERYTGLLAEIRSEGIAMVDPLQELTDHPIPEEGTRGHAALLLAEYLANALREDPGASIPLSLIEQRMERFAVTHGSKWRKGVREPGGLQLLLEEVLRIFSALRLVRIDEDGTLTPLPAIGRYRLKELTMGSGIS